MTTSSLALIALGALAAQLEVPLTGWLPPQDIDLVVDAEVPEVAFFDATHARSPRDLARFVDMACVVWGRTSGVADVHRCRAARVVDVEPSFSPLLYPQLGVVERQGWRDDDTSALLFLAPEHANIEASTWCDTPFLSPLLVRAECDVWLSTKDRFGAYLGAQHNPIAAFSTGLELGPKPLADGTTKRAGAPSPLLGEGRAEHDLWRTVLHETGHMLGLSHPSTCDPVRYDCPAMSATAQQVVSTWPTLDEQRAFSRRINGRGARTVEWSLWKIDVNGALEIVQPWTAFAETDVEPAHVVRVACRPEIGALSRSCVLAAHRAGEAPRFYALDVDTEVRAHPPVEGGKVAERGVDVAFGQAPVLDDAGAVLRWEDRMLAVGKRPVDRQTATHLVVYAGRPSTTPQSIVLRAAAGDVAQAVRFTTHTEPRVSFHESAGVFVVGYPRTDGRVELVSLTPSGSVVDVDVLHNLDGTDVQTIWPVELLCDTHLMGRVSTCRVLVQPYGAAPHMARFALFTYPVELDDDGRFVREPTSGEVRAGSTHSWHAQLLLVDAFSYGNGFVAGEQWGQNAFFVTQDRLAEHGADTISIQLDEDGSFNAPGRAGPSLYIDHLSMGAGARARQTNMTSWDWDESSAHVVAVRTGGFGGVAP